MFFYDYSSLYIKVKKVVFKFFYEFFCNRACWNYENSVEKCFKKPLDWFFFKKPDNESQEPNQNEPKQNEPQLVEPEFLEPQLIDLLEPKLVEPFLSKFYIKGFSYESLFDKFILFDYNPSKPISSDTKVKNVELTNDELIELELVNLGYIEFEQKALSFKFSIFRKEFDRSVEKIILNWLDTVKEEFQIFVNYFYTNEYNSLGMYKEILESLRKEKNNEIIIQDMLDFYDYKLKFNFLGLFEFLSFTPFVYFIFVFKPVIIKFLKSSCYYIFYTEESRFFKILNFFFNLFSIKKLVYTLTSSLVYYFKSKFSRRKISRIIMFYYYKLRVFKLVNYLKTFFKKHTIYIIYFILFLILFIFLFLFFVFYFLVSFTIFKILKYFKLDYLLKLNYNVYKYIFKKKVYNIILIFIKEVFFYIYFFFFKIKSVFFFFKKKILFFIFYIVYFFCFLIYFFFLVFITFIEYNLSLINDYIIFSKTFFVLNFFIFIFLIFISLIKKIFFFFFNFIDFKKNFFFYFYFLIMLKKVFFKIFFSFKNTFKIIFYYLIKNFLKNIFFFFNLIISFIKELINFKKNYYFIFKFYFFYIVYNIIKLFKNNNIVLLLLESVFYIFIFFLYLNKFLYHTKFIFFYKVIKKKFYYTRDVTKADINLSYFDTNVAKIKILYINLRTNLFFKNYKKLTRIFLIKIFLLNFLLNKLRKVNLPIYDQDKYFTYFLFLKSVKMYLYSNLSLRLIFFSILYKSRKFLVYKFYNFPDKFFLGLLRFSSHFLNYYYLRYFFYLFFLNNIFFNKQIFFFKSTMYYNFIIFFNNFFFKNDLSNIEECFKFYEFLWLRYKLLEFKYKMFFLKYRFSKVVFEAPEFFFYEIYFLKWNWTNFKEIDFYDFFDYY